MTHKLRIPYARSKGQKITVEDLALKDRLELSEMRVTAFRARRALEAAPYSCPECGMRVYPKYGPDNGRAHWAHFAREAMECPFYLDRRPTDDEIAAIIFRGRQEGCEHKYWVDRLANAIQLDPLTIGDSVEVNIYMKSSTDTTGRYPDIQFNYNGRKIVFEIQIAPISLNRISGRREFYNSEGVELFWICPTFDPNEARAFNWDLTADQDGRLFTLDKTTLDEIAADNRIRLIVYDYNKDTQSWLSKIDVLETLNAYDREKDAHYWASSFRKRWRDTYSIHRIIDEPDLFPELSLRANLNFEYIFDTNGGLSEHEIRKLVNALISIYFNRILGTRDRNIKGFVNNYFLSENLSSTAGLLWKAFFKFWPNEFKGSIAEIIREKAKSPQQKRHSWLGKLRNTLFPDWAID